MARSIGIGFILTVIVGSTGCGYMEHLLGRPEAAPPLGETLLGGARGLFDSGVLGEIAQDAAGQCIPSETDEPCNDATLSVDVLVGIWVEAEYGALAVHVEPDGSIRQADIAGVVAGEPLPAGIPRTLYNAGQLSLSPDGSVTLNADLTVAGFAAVGEGVGYLDSSLNAIFGMTVQGTITVLGQTTEVYVPGTVWLRWDPETSAFPYLSDPALLAVAGNPAP